jgi:hypothetical protein
VKVNTEAEMRIQLTEHFESSQGVDIDVVDLVGSKKRKLNQSKINVFTVAAPEFPKAFFKWMVMSYMPLDTCEDPYFRCVNDY